jgi:hypothetical protein
MNRLVLVVLLGMVAAGAAPTYRADQSAGNASAIPVAPEQSLPWTPPPTKLAPVVVSAITELFRDGMADPRGCEYREIEVKAGIELNIKTHGWILPGAGPSRFAVGWNGLVYPVVTIGSPADLQKDIADLVAKDQKQWSSYTGTNRDVRGNWTAPEWVSVSRDNLLPLKVAMLLRLGRADLAESVWNQWFALSTDGEEDPYLLLAREWTESLYNRALYAHLRGDDVVSLAACRTLLPLRSTVEAVAARRGFAKDASGKPYLEDLEQLPKLAADQERRAQEPPYIPVLQSGQPAQGPERIAALIHDLELVSARQEMNPGQTDVSTDPIVHALIEEGDPAVEPLLKCFEEDTRLTRSEFTQGMQIKPGPIIPVYEPAFVAIVGILKTPFYFSDSDNRQSNDPYQAPSDPRDMQPRNLSLDDRKFLAAKIRAYWERNKSISLPERWYATLEDDQAGANAWFQAVGNIVQTTNGTTMPLTMFGGGWWSGGGGPQGTPVVMRGESLRDKTNPSVSDLIIKRFNQLIAQSASDKSISFDPVGKLILALADWDGKAHLDDLREMAQTFHTRFPHEQGAFVSTLQTEAMIYRKRLALGDPRALQEYAEWLVAINPTEWNYFRLGDPFQIMWHHPTDPVIQKAAEKIFANKDSPWIPLSRIEDLGDLLTRPLIGLAAFRQEAIQGLGDKSPAGTVKLYDNGNASYLLTGEYQDVTVPPYKDDPLAPASGSVVTFRLCDYYAYQLSRVDCFPQIELYWPQVERNAAIAACRKLLERYGDAFQARPQDPYDDSVYAQDSMKQTYIAFARLDHPAMPDDVEHGRAIFTLSGTVRLWDMPVFPLAAQRPSAKFDPVTGYQDLPNGKIKTSVTYTTEGKVWQAEEVQVNGKWLRYYGFAGRHQLEKVPASEIFFPSDYPWSSAGGWMDGRLDGPPVKSVPVNSFTSYSVAALGVPLPVTLKVRNHNGIDETMPSGLVLPPNANQALPPDISLSVFYSKKIPPEIFAPPAKPVESWWFLGASQSKPPFDYGAWTALPLRKEIKVATAAAPGPVVGAAHELTLLKIDLRDFFDLSHPGTYRVKALFHVPGQPPADSSEITFSVAGAAQ